MLRGRHGVELPVFAYVHCLGRVRHYRRYINLWGRGPIAAVQAIGVCIALADTAPWCIGFMARQTFTNTNCHRFLPFGAIPGIGLQALFAKDSQKTRGFCRHDPPNFRPGATCKSSASHHS